MRNKTCKHVNTKTRQEEQRQQTNLKYKTRSANAKQILQTQNKSRDCKKKAKPELRRRNLNCDGKTNIANAKHESQKQEKNCKVKEESQTEKQEL